MSDEFKGNLMDAEMEVAGIGATMEDVVYPRQAGEFGISATDALIYLLKSLIQQNCWFIK